MNRRLVCVVTVSCATALGCSSSPPSATDDAAWRFAPLAGSAYDAVGVDASDPSALHAAPWRLPPGFTQRVIADESALNLYTKTTCEQFGDGRFSRGSDWPDMMTVNETGASAGRYLYRTHEVRPFLYDSKCQPNVPASEQAVSDFRAEGGGAVTVIDLQTGDGRVLLQRSDFEGLDGLMWTPWGTLLFAEEAIDVEVPDATVTNAKSGLVYEARLDPQDPRQVLDVTVRPQLGSLAHEGLEIDAQGSIYVVDEYKTGSVYRFVPARRGDLSAGQLYALKVDSATKRGAAKWVALDMKLAQVRARDAAVAVGATPYCRPEDMERIADTLYVALTCEDVSDPTSTKGAGAVLAVALGEQPEVSYFVGAGDNIPRENREQGITGLKSPDNLVAGSDGRLWIVEDNVPSDIWVAEPDRNGDGRADKVSLFASLQDPWAEGTGLYFSPDHKTLYVNVQHSRTGSDRTIAIVPGAR